MGNVRMKSLPANRAVASHDCPTCVKRRIQCDRTEPGCMKCASRGLGCPGFKAVYLKWNQGIASRGKHAGKFAPVARTSLDSDNQSVVRKQRQRLQSSDSEITNASRRQICVPADTNAESTSQALAMTCKDPDPTRDERIADSFLSASIFQTLIHHFCTKAVSRLTWIDQPSHPWRTIVQGLLQHSACVQLSVSSLAAAHLSMTPSISSEQSSSLFVIYSSLRDRSLRILSAKMRSEMRSSHPIAAKASGEMSATEILASMLALCYTEVFVPGSRDWKVHLRACRTIINLQQLEDWTKTSSDPVLKFLLKEITDLEILTSTTAFEDDIMPLSAISLQSNNPDSGWAFTSLIHKITTLERKRHFLRQTNGALPPVDMAVWCRRVEEAQTRTMACPRLTSASRSQALRESFQALTRAYYYATLLYSYQAFATADEKAQMVGRLTDNLLEDIKLAGTTDDLFHDLFFPLFIVGVETISDREQQVFIDKLFVESLSRTGIWCNYPALQFLRSMWASPGNLLEHESWIDFARANVSTLGTFVVF
ncbi:hypothetical protein QQS21_000719 [Conoideocrella luteorostrata]|uniref:Zn(2)-C6 fungal-type domain-containing protein n=1 Tax=Conoideocrella luteorostrata TaxID=1105319 RepID=A0AAJ0CZ84_9HYPO|nr:hypothetical protein QQS21_000719 [Conoideocrella luteorostrata]